MGRRYGKFTASKNLKKEEGRQGRRIGSQQAEPRLGVPDRGQSRSRSRSRLGVVGNRGKNRKEKKAPGVGLFVTKELRIAIESTKVTVERIARECRAKNKRFRDTEFDLEYDSFRCLHGYPEVPGYVGRDVQRVTEIFTKPVFFPDSGAAHSAVRQGSLDNCYFLSALATVSGLPGLIEKICVARDETVGVYGFIFYQDKGWVSVIVDDMLCTNIPKYESLDFQAKSVYLEDKRKYESMARKGGRSLLYAKAGMSDETWVPLIEKAYAKLYSCYAHTSDGLTREAIEDLTGGVATNLNARDILDTDRFWKEELARVNKDRLFACSFDDVDAPGDDPSQRPKVQGLIGGHAYAVIRVAEINGKRFVVLRNPWGQAEWTGAWSDGSKEWTPEWLKCLPELDHTFGDDGQFVMEYGDFLRYFTDIDRAILFDNTWTIASCWLRVPIATTPAAPAYGTLSFGVTIPKKTNAIFVLSTLNNRSFRSIKNDVDITFEFSIVRVGEFAPLGTGAPDRPFSRSATLEIEIEAGEYVVYVKLGQMRILEPDLNSHIVSKILTSKVECMSLLENWDRLGEADYLVKSLKEVIEDELDETSGGGDDDSDPETEGEDDDESDGDGSELSSAGPYSATDALDTLKPGGEAALDATVGGGIFPGGETAGEVIVPIPQMGSEGDYDDEPPDPEWFELLNDKGENAALGLRVYTQTKDQPAVVVGHVKWEGETVW